MPSYKNEETARVGLIQFSELSYKAVRFVTLFLLQKMLARTKSAVILSYIYIFFYLIAYSVQFYSFCARVIIYAYSLRVYLYIRTCVHKYIHV